MVSVIIPTYNREIFLRNSILSVNNQSYKNWELIIVDDGSTDNTKQLIDDMKKNLNINLKYYYKENGGVSSSRNYGIKVSNGDYIAFLDSDDEWDKLKLEKQIKRMIETNTRVNYCGTLKKFVDNDMKIENKFEEGLILKNIIKYTVNAETITWIVEKKLLIDNNIFFEENCSFAEDLEFFIKVCSIAEVSCIKEYLAIYNMHNASLSNNIENHIEEIHVFNRLKTWMMNWLVSGYKHEEIITLIDQYRIPIAIIKHILNLKNRKKPYSYLFKKYKIEISQFDIRLSDRKIRDYLLYNSINNEILFATLKFLQNVKKSLRMRR